MANVTVRSQSLDNYKSSRKFLGPHSDVVNVLTTNARATDQHASPTIDALPALLICLHTNTHTHTRTSKI